MKKRAFLLILLSVVILVLEWIPGSVVLRFANPEGEPWIRTYPYFSLTPFGYANFGPFLTAILTCILLLLVIIHWFWQGNGLNTSIAVLSALATITNFLPLMYGVSYLTPIGVVIGLLLAGIFFLCLPRKKQ
jgi:hypothetical protein